MRLTTSTSLAVAALTLSSSSTNAFSTPKLSKSSSTNTELQMGLFDGVKNAFSQPPLERSNLDSERETPIDRWMGWSVTKDEETKNEVAKSGSKAPANFVDSMDATNYIEVSLSKPMGIVFEENDEETGGIFVQALTDGGSAAVNGNIKIGDQLVSVGQSKVSGMAFDVALGTIVDSVADPVSLLIFRGTADQFYGPTGASQEWLNEFIPSKK